MNIRDLAGADILAILPADGLALTYTPPGGTPIETKGFFSYGASPETSVFPDLPAQSDAAIAIVPSSSVETPEYQATIEFNGELWTVQRGWRQLPGAWKLPLIKDIRPTHRK